MGRGGGGTRKFKLLRRAGIRIYWCTTCNLPLLASICGICGGRGRLVRTTPPSDARPAVGVEYRQLWRLIEKETGIKNLYPKRKVVLLNKVPYPDAADEVVIDGYVIGHRFYDLRTHRWRFKPLYAGVSEIIRRREGYYALVKLETITRNYEIHRDKIAESSLPPRGERWRYVALATPTGFEGIGLVTRSGRIRVLKSWRARRYEWGSKDPSWAEVVEANEARLAILEQEAIRFINEVYERYQLPPIVSFSGGKDSLVTYHLVKKALGRVPVIFNDTGLELPETLSYVKAFSEREGVELIEANAGGAFWSSVEVMGPPARDYRWCCKVAKLLPLAKALKERFADGAISFVGQRRLESASRAVSPKVYRNRWIPHVVVAAPINDWSSLDVWLYIFRERLIPNPLYYLGFDRLGCWLCPAMEMGEVEVVREVHPNLWSKWRHFLHRYAEERGMPREWLQLGLWRWLKPPGDICRLVRDKSSIVRSAERGIKIEVELSHQSAAVKVFKPVHSLTLSRLANTLCTLAEVTYDGEAVTMESVRVVVTRFKEGVIVKFEERGSEGRSLPVEELLRATLRAAYCIKCGSCELWCPKEAVKVSVEGPSTNFKACVHCGLCNEVCPVADYGLRALLFRFPRDLLGI